MDRAESNTAAPAVTAQQTVRVERHARDKVHVPFHPRNGRPERASHTRAVWSSLPVRRGPSGLYTTLEPRHLCSLHSNSFSPSASQRETKPCKKLNDHSPGGTTQTEGRVRLTGESPYYPDTGTPPLQRSPPRQVSFDLNTGNCRTTSSAGRRQKATCNDMVIGPAATFNGPAFQASVVPAWVGAPWLYSPVSFKKGCSYHVAPLLVWLQVLRVAAAWGEARFELRTTQGLLRAQVVS
jgi:hypothetical protein